MNLELIPHSSTAPRAVKHVSVQIHRLRDMLQLLYVVEADPERLALPPPLKPYRADRLWEATCFELFVRGAGESYREFNFSPSSQWAAYEFQSYRADVAPLALEQPPGINLSIEPYALLLSASVNVDWPSKARIGLSAVIEETDGTKSYWALAHPPGKPDFHHDHCFAAELGRAS